jgi:nicotinate-nucleotide pyrophosphorylase (carboxylating)
MKEYQQINAQDDRLVDDLRRLTRLAIWEDLQNGVDITTLAIVPEHLRSSANIVARKPGIASGVELIDEMIQESETRVHAIPKLKDGSHFSAGEILVRLEGGTRDLLTLERTILNFLGKLCGIATMAGEYVKRIEGTGARGYDTRKTTPGWRYLEKYAVRCGGGFNHRIGLYDAILIKDNHLACYQDAVGTPLAPADAVYKARDFCRTWPDKDLSQVIIEVEVDSLEQFSNALPAAPDIILLDNMTPAMLTKAVQLRNESKSKVQLEASGGVSIHTIGEIAKTGVDRISVGALTHSAINLDLGLDWTETRPPPLK